MSTCRAVGSQQNSRSSQPRDHRGDHKTRTRHPPDDTVTTFSTYPELSLRDYETIVNLIARTTTAKGLQVTCRLDRRKYPTGRKVTDEEIKRVNLKRANFMVNGITLSTPQRREHTFIY
jgi:Rhodopirellula transposase DDE domain